MRNIIAVRVVWASAVSAQRVEDLCLQKDGITLSESVISVLRKKVNFRWTVIFQDDDKLSDPNSCFQPSVERNFKIALLLNWCFLLKEKTQHLSQPIRRKVKHKYYLSAANSIPALLFLWFTELRTLFTAVIGQTRNYNFWRTLFRYRRQLQ